MKRTIAILTLLATPLAARAADVSQLLGTLNIIGTIQPGDFYKVRDTLDAKTFTVLLRSPGGNVIEARRIGDLLASRYLQVQVRRDCTSACASEIFLVARRRTLRRRRLRGVPRR